jgi:serine/threonine protein kinase
VTLVRARVFAILFLRQILQSLIDDAYGQFVQAVADGRKMTVDEVKPLADGRIYSGRQALELKLVDQLGDSLDEAFRNPAAMMSIASLPFQLEQIAIQLCSAVAALVAAGVVHSDLKPTQFCFAQQPPLIKMLDFDSACDVGQPLVRWSELHAAPEVLLAVRAGAVLPVAASSMDVYSLGLVLLQMYSASRQPVFERRGADDEAVLAAAIDGLAAKRAREVLRHMLATRPAERWTIREVLQHDLFKVADSELLEQARIGDKIDAVGYKVDAVRRDVVSVESMGGLVLNTVNEVAAAAAASSSK